MPPKKKEQAPKPPKILGRMGTNLKIGIVGLPNVGKSTFFNVLTKSPVAAENFPFCTIDPNECRVPVPDERWEFLCEHHKPASKVPAFLNVVDIAGLVKGAHEGQGLGNAFLSNISACDAIFHMCRVYENSEVTHMDRCGDPVNDIEIISQKLIEKDLEKVQKLLCDQKLIDRGNKKNIGRKAILKVVEGMLLKGKHIRNRNWNARQIDELNKHLFLTAKPVIYLVNQSENNYIRRNTKRLFSIKKWIDKHDPGATIIPYSASLEANLFDMSPEEKNQYCEENKVTSALPKIIRTSYNALNLEHYFTCGPDEVKAWTIKKYTRAPQAAGKIHTDFEKGFIMAEVMAFEDFKELGSENACKAAGKYRQEGKQYVVQDGDIIFFKFNTGKKK